MLVFKFELTPYSIETGIDGFSRGHITIQDKQEMLTSKGRVPDQSMMIFHSISSLLDDTRQFFQNPRAKGYTPTFTSSFQFTIKRHKNGMFILTSSGKNFEEVTQADLVVKAIWNGVNDFLDKYGKYVNITDSIYDDLSESVEDFQDLFGL